jgi:hypothetical protein
MAQKTVAKPSPSEAGRALQLQIAAMAWQSEHNRRLTMYASMFSAGATFEVFGLTLGVTGLLVAHGLPSYWVALVFVYFFTGVLFISLAARGFG